VKVSDALGDGSQGFMVKIGSDLRKIESRVTRVTSRNSLYLVVTLLVVGSIFGLLHPTFEQMIGVLVFATTVAGTLLFWRFRLAFAIGGVGIILLLGVVHLDVMIQSMNMEVVLFLVSMMVIIESLERSGFLRVMITALVARVHGQPKRLMVALMCLGAVLAALMDEVTAMLLLGTLILDLSKSLGVDARPYLLSTVMAINIGSAATLLGNPIGVLIAFKAGLSFDEFLVWATPIAILALLVTIPIVVAWYRKALDDDRQVIARSTNSASPVTRAHSFSGVDWMTAIIFAAVIAAIVSQSAIESALGLPRNTILVAAPMLGAALMLLVKNEEAKELVESGVDWWTLLFFVFLFGAAATLEHTGTTLLVANQILEVTGGNDLLLSIVLTWPVMLLSGTIDNVPLIAGVIPVILRLGEAGIDVYALWWTILFAGCLGGNLTMVGSTANIVAIGLSEKREQKSLTMRQWIGLGVVVSVSTVLLVQMAILLRTPYPI
jgi:Na+/H+ antiporter NhaD/arsenite permease-like protein